MYNDIETETSYKYLNRVISRLKEPICILGGWAVFFTVNPSYQKQMVRTYIGSRDIDIGFNSVDSFKEATSILEKELNFKFISFRYFKNIHSETGKDLDENEAKSIPQHMFFPIYVDPIMPYVDKYVKTKIGFNPIDEPLLKYVFESRKYRIRLREFGKILLLPTPEILLATKINAVVLREKEYKRHKDICDIVALCLFGGIPINNIIKRSMGFASKDRLEKFRNINFKQDIINCSNILGLELNTVKSVIVKIKEGV